MILYTFLLLIAVSLCTSRHSNEEFILSNVPQIAQIHTDFRPIRSQGWRGIKNLAMLCGMGPPYYSLLIGESRYKACNYPCKGMQEHLDIED